MIKKLLLTFIGALLNFYILHAWVWIIASAGLLGSEFPFGYHSEFYVVRGAVKNLPCVTGIAYGRHEDLFKDDFRFLVHTASGRQIRLYFHADQDVNRICVAPKGIMVVNPGAWRDSDQLYDIDSIADYLNHDRNKILGMQDSVCDIDKLAPLFEANYYDKAIPLITLERQYHTREFRKYLRLEIVDEQINIGLWEEPLE